MIALPESWSDWKLTRMIGEGAFAVVYEAQRRDDPSIRAAIKIISIPQDPSEIQELVSQGYNLSQTKDYFNQTVDEFIHEVKIMEFFKGTQNIVSIEDYRIEPQENDVGSHIFIRMELLTSLDNYISDKQLSEKEVIRLGTDICTALSLCMSQKVIHRDIKPENIFVNDKIGTNVFYKLGDFGIARSLEHRTAGLSSKGTPNYIAPEVASGKKYDTRADIYSLGLTLYRLLNNNRLPFFPQTSLYTPAAKREAVMRRLSGEQLPPPVNASPKMADVLLKACSYLPEDRYQSAEEMKRALMDLENDRQGRSPASRKNTPPAREKTGNASQIILIVLLTVIVVLLLVFGGGMLLRQYVEDLIHDEPTTAADTIGIPDSLPADSHSNEVAGSDVADLSQAPSELTAEPTDTPAPVAAGPVIPVSTIRPVALPDSTETNEELSATPTPTLHPTSGVIESNGQEITWSFSERDLYLKGKGNIPDYSADASDIPWADLNPERVYIQTGITGIGAHAFQNGHSIKAVYFLSNVKSIGEGAFRGCSSLEEITLPASVEKVDDWAFADCTSLKKMTVGNKVVRLGAT